MKVNRTIRIASRVSEEVKKLLEEAAIREERSESKIIEKAVRDYLGHNS